MRQIRITTQKRQMEAKDNTMLWCPVLTDPKGLCYCTDKCAWFRIENQQIDETSNVITLAFCGDKLIGEIIGDSK